MVFILEGILSVLWDRKYPPTLFPKAFGPSNSTFLLFHALTVCDTASFSALVIELPLRGRIVIIKIMKKNKGNRACFCGRAADSAHHLHF